MSEQEQPPFEPMPIEGIKKLYDRLLAGEGIQPHEGKSLIETLFWLSQEHAVSMKDLQNMKWMSRALMTMIHQWGRGGKLELSAKATDACAENWTLNISVDLKGSIKLKINGYPKSRLILPGGLQR